MRRLSALVIALALLAVAAVPAEAATPHRIFTAKMGSGGINGTAKFTYNTDGSGRIDYALKGLRKGATYRVEIRRKTCANLGTLVTRLLPVTSSSTGKVTFGKGISGTNSSKIWTANWYNRLSIRIVSGTSIKCGTLNFTHVTRTVVPAYNIDLPTVRAPSGYPYCNVAMYLGTLNQPTEPGTTFIMAHARKGMFLPLLRQWQLNKGVNMIGKKVYVYTSNSKVHTYQIYAVKGVTSVQGAVTATAEQLWLQTSTGPHGTALKLVVKARRLSTASTTYAASHPKPHIVHCGF